MKQLLLTIMIGSSLNIAPLPVLSQAIKTPLVSSEITESQIYQLAYSITVKVISDQTWGSGIIVDKRGQTYTILTNRHVLTASENHQIQTADGKVYPASVKTNINLGGNDLALLQFQSSQNYPTAIISNSLSLTPGENVFAVGFPFLTEGYNPNGQGFVFTKGNITLILNKPLQEGYQLGYTNNVSKGMSGGAILNDKGEVIGINGRHAYPLWGDPFIYQDGSQPNPQLKQQMISVSWGIPSETFKPLLRIFSQQNQNSASEIMPLSNQENPNCIQNNYLLQQENIKVIKPVVDFYQPSQLLNLPEHSPNYLW